MADRALVLDANILIRAVLGRSARQLIQRYAASIDFVAPDTVFLEAEEHIPALCAKLGLDLDAVRAVYTGVSNLVQELPVAAYQEQEAQARARIERRDADDWPVIAWSRWSWGAWLAA